MRGKLCQYDSWSLSLLCPAPNPFESVPSSDFHLDSLSRRASLFHHSAFPTTGFLLRAGLPTAAQPRNRSQRKGGDLRG